MPAYHPVVNGQVERLHRQLQAAIMAHNTMEWTKVLPSELLGIRTAWEKDLRGMAAEMVYGTSIAFPWEFIVPAADTPDPIIFGWLCEVMKQLRPDTSWSTDRPIFVYKDLKADTHVFLRRDGVKKNLEAPFEGSYQVLQRSDKHFFSLQINDRTVIVDSVMVKPAFLMMSRFLILIQQNQREEAR